MDVKNFYMILMTYSINLNHKKRFNAKSFILSNGGAGPESNRRIEDLQSPALPLGYRAVAQSPC